LHNNNEVTRGYGASPIVSRIRAVQTGSVNDYTSYLILGVLVTVASTSVPGLLR
jgi:hypothetical protein